MVGSGKGFFGNLDCTISSAPRNRRRRKIGSRGTQARLGVHRIRFSRWAKGNCVHSRWRPWHGTARQARKFSARHGTGLSGTARPARHGTVIFLTIHCFEHVVPCASLFRKETFCVGQCLLLLHFSKRATFFGQLFPVAALFRKKHLLDQLCVFCCAFQKKRHFLLTCFSR